MSAIDMNAAIALAHQLWQAEQERAPRAPVRDAIAALGGNPLEAAYAVQRVNTERKLASGRRLVGRKIGLTSKAVQAQLGVDQPDFGMLFDDMAIADGEEIALSRTLQPYERHTIADLIRATAYALPAIEIVGSRIANWDIRLTDTVADNASSGLFVLGNRPVKLDAFDAIQCGMVMERRGDQVSVGAGAACLGNPLHAALWLANTMTRVNAPLKAGDIVLTGALGPMVGVAPGDVFTAHIEGLGSVSACFSTQPDSAQ